jgi:hypothetical protein
MPDVLGSVPASEELPRVVAVFRAHTAHKTLEFLDLRIKPGFPFSILIHSRTDTRGFANAKFS